MPLIAVLDADPDLGDVLAPEVRAVARRHALARLETIETGTWNPAVQFGEAPPTVGLLVVEGLMTRDISFAGRTTTELLGGGDLLRPWDQDATFDPLPIEIRWHALERTRLAVLDRHFASVVGRWPALVDAVVARAVKRSRSLAFQLAVSQVTRVDGRLLVLFWQLADRWGRVTPHGVLVPLELTHETLGKLVGARRPSVTTALGQLGTRGLIERSADGWLLHGDPEQILDELHQNHARVAQLGARRAEVS
jgi:CRP/FNR family transcriptional regulator, cyclic AMP receptor protein